MGLGIAAERHVRLCHRHRHCAPRLGARVCQRAWLGFGLGLGLGLGFGVRLGVRLA